MPMERIKIRDLVTNKYIYDGIPNTLYLTDLIRRKAETIENGFRKYYLLEIFINNKSVGDFKIEVRDLDKDLPDILSRLVEKNK